MDRYELIGLKFRLQHALPGKKRLIIDSYPELIGKSIVETQKMIDINDCVIKGISLNQLKNLKLKKNIGQ